MTTVMSLPVHPPMGPHPRAVGPHRATVLIAAEAHLNLLRDRLHKDPVKVLTAAEAHLNLQDRLHSLLQDRLHSLLQERLHKDLAKALTALLNLLRDRLHSLLRDLLHKDPVKVLTAAEAHLNLPRDLLHSLLHKDLVKDLIVAPLRLDRRHPVPRQTAHQKAARHQPAVLLQANQEVLQWNLQLVEVPPVSQEVLQWNHQLVGTPRDLRAAPHRNLQPAAHLHLNPDPPLKDQILPHRDLALAPTVQKLLAPLARPRKVQDPPLILPQARIPMSPVPQVISLDLVALEVTVATVAQEVADHPVEKVETVAMVAQEAAVHLVEKVETVAREATVAAEAALTAQAVDRLHLMDPHPAMAPAAAATKRFTSTSWRNFLPLSTHIHTNKQMID